MTREQKRAKEAYALVKAYERKSDALEKKAYGSMAHRFPALLRSAGLAQAVAFVDSRGKEEHKQYLLDLAKVVAHMNNKHGEALEWLRERSHKAELPEYLHLTRETLAVSDWFKRFAQSVLKVEGGGDE